jgi:DNA-binding IclR family transcriptional regulator
MANSPSGESMIARMTRVLDTFSADRTVQTATEIGRRAQLPRSTAHRLVDELTAAGLLERDEEGRVRLGMRLWELALRGSTALRLRQAALPHMETVQAELREHTQLAVLEHDEALFLERLSHPEAVSNITRVAGRLPLHASSSGLVLLAHAPPALRERVLASHLQPVGPATITDARVLRRTLAETRRTGWVAAPGSIEAVSTGVAVPVRDRGSVIAALSVVMPRESPIAAASKALRSAAARIEAGLKDSR